MGDGDHVLAGLFGGYPFDRTARAVVEIHETFAARRRLVDIGEPVAAGRLAGKERGAVHALPLAEMLLGQRRFVLHRGGPRKPAAQIASAV